MSKKYEHRKTCLSTGKILLIDDEPELLALMKEMLEDEGYQVFCALNGAAGVHLNEKENPDLIILDLRMPGMDGLETLRQIRKTDGEVRVIILTTYGSVESIKAAASLNVNEYLSKPFENRDLIRMVGDMAWRQTWGNESAKSLD